MFSLNLYRRCLLLVIFPLVCQIVFVGALVYFLLVLQAEIKAEAGSRELISKLMKVERHILEDMSMVGDPAVDSDLDGLFAELNATLVHEQADPAKRVQAQQIQESAARLQKFQQERIAGRAHSLGQQQDMLKNCMQFMEEVGKLVAFEEDKRSRSPLRSHGTRTVIVELLAVALILSIVVAGVLGYLYSIRISEPLQRITENSRLLSRRQPLLPVLKGADELCELDHLFHQLADSINEAINRETAMIDNAADLICTLDYTGAFTASNPVAEKMLAIKAEELQGKSLADLTVASESLLADEHIRAACSSKDAQVFELKLVGINGTVADTRWASFWSEQASRLFCVVRDVTEEKRISQMKQDFLNMISHDLRSPLTSMLGTMSLISVGAFGEVSKELRSEVDSMSRNIDRLVNFVNDILDFQKLEAGKMELDLANHDLRAIISDSLTLVVGLAENKQIEVRVPERNWQVYCDGQKIVQTLVNLLSNAIKFTPPRSSVIVSVDEPPGFIQLNVSDRGPGVPSELREKIFEAFEQTPSVAKSKVGTGLGLAIAKLIVEAHGGSIGVIGHEADAQNANGSTFWIRIPSARSDAT